MTKNLRFVGIACSAAASMLIWPSLGTAQTFTDQSVSGDLSFNGESVYSSDGENVRFQGASDSGVYGDAATGRLALNATSITFGSQIREVDASVSYRSTFVNTGPTGQFFDFNFIVNKGDLEAVGGGSFNSGYGAGVADLTGSVAIDGKQAWFTSASCSSNKKCTFAGSDLGYVEERSSIGHGYSFEDYRGSASLGFLNPGESVSIDYLLKAHATSGGLGVSYATVGPNSAFSKNDFSILGGVDSEVGKGSVKPSEPVPVEPSQPVPEVPMPTVPVIDTPVLQVPVSPVPEPSTLAMLMLGLGSLGMFFRRRC